ncbi:MAG: hypothetical protein IJ773_06310 [Lachnospiraceae bacterium]|nr:hypothetical protein [Lachnospiraceae bacterium]
MLNEEKIRLMTKAAAFEEREKKGILRTNRFFCFDFVTGGMLKTAVGITIGAVLVAALWGLIHIEELLTQTRLEAFIDIGLTIVFYYAIVLLIYTAISLVVYLIKYWRAEAQMQQYVNLLRRIEKIDEREASRGSAPAAEDRHKETIIR